MQQYTTAGGCPSTVYAVTARGRQLAPSAVHRGLSQVHNSPPRVEYSCGGTKVKVRMPSGCPPTGGARGRVAGFSARSRRRLLDTLHEVQRGQLPIFVTLTYPASWPDNPKEWKRHIDNFGKALTRMGPYGAVWKLEPQKRGAPHFHLLVWGVRHLRRFRRWLAATWYRIVGSGDEKHLRAGTQANSVRSQRGVVAYASKYMTKDVEAAGWENPGRFWGVIGRHAIPWAYTIVEEVPAWFAHRLKRWLRRATRYGYVSHLVQTFYVQLPEVWWARLPEMVTIGSSP